MTVGSDELLEAPQNLLRKATITPDELLQSGLIPISRNAVYGACHRFLETGDCRDGIECFRVGKLLMIPTAPLRRKLGLDEA